MPGREERQEKTLETVSAVRGKTLEILHLPSENKLFHRIGLDAYTTRL